ncbi:MAG: hypothetical protein VW491_10350, partial [Gammaproteobacteria bacterium]
SVLALPWVLTWREDRPSSYWMLSSPVEQRHWYSANGAVIGNRCCGPRVQCRFTSISIRSD